MYIYTYIDVCVCVCVCTQQLIEAAFFLNSRATQDDNFHVLYITNSGYTEGRGQALHTWHHFDCRGYGPF